MSISLAHVESAAMKEVALDTHAPGRVLDEQVLPSNIAKTIPVRSNLSDADTLANIRHAVSLDLPWLDESPPHNGRAIIVAGGPSVHAYLNIIKGAQKSGAVVFAPNGAMGMLNDHDVTPDYFVMLDGRPGSVRFINDGFANKYLIASQCDPSVFDDLEFEDVTLWHSNYEGVQEHTGNRPCVLVSGGCTVGLQALSIAFAMGFRSIDLYGFDSSFSGGLGHAYPMPENVGEARFEYSVLGKRFIAAPWMMRQAMEFQIAARQLADEDCTISVHGFGLLPEIARHMSRPAMTEKAKYELMWGFDAYRNVSPGEHAVEQFLSVVSVTDKTRVIDFGCGTGRGGRKIHAITGADVLLVDFASNALDGDVELPFKALDMSETMGLSGEVGFCADVLEHIPTDSVPAVIKNIMACVREAYFQISLTNDNCGALIGHTLHMSVFPAEWWLSQFGNYKVKWFTGDEQTLAVHVSY
ncbi:MAG: DUF115 domain-containing protein [Gammaproteobacteria bacterium]|nr:DUF115 domain-containing protein [Gammaproteobacteria bacterium]